MLAGEMETFLVHQEQQKVAFPSCDELNLPHNISTFWDRPRSEKALQEALILFNL